MTQHTPRTPLAGVDPASLHPGPESCEPRTVLVHAFAVAAAGVAVAALSLAACGPGDGTEGGCKDRLVAGDLVITEIFADYSGPGDDGKEWFEVYNASDRAVELEGLTVTHARPDGESPKSHVMEPVTVAPGQYLTLGNSIDDLLPPYIDYGFSADLGDFFNTNGGKLDLRCGPTVIDSAVYEGVREGRSRQLTSGQPPDYTLNDEQVNWCEANDTEFEPDNFGTPGQENDCRPVVTGKCDEGGSLRDAVLPGPGELVITEVMPSPDAVGDDFGEWFEARATASFDLNGLALDRAGDSSMPDVIEAPDCLRVNAGDYVLFARSIDPAMNGGLPAGAVRATFGFTLVGGSASSPGDVQILANETLIDAVTWTRSANGRSLQLDPDVVDASANDMPANFCDATTAYGTGSPQDRGTPNADNDQCMTMPPAGMCDDGGSVRAVVKPTAGQLVITEFLSDPAGTDTSKEWFEITNTGGASFDLNGLTLGRAASTSSTTIASATCLEVAPGAFALFARSADPAANSMLPTPDATFGFGLVQTNGDVEVRDGMTVLDAITWPSSTSGTASQLDPDQFTTTGNDNLANFCPATATYGDNTNRGTPKAANAQCP